MPSPASHLLGCVSRRLSRDWQRKYGHPIYLLETFVQRDRFTGTCYQAANWRYVGQTRGRTHQDRPDGQQYRLPVKDAKKSKMRRTRIGDSPRVLSFLERFKPENTCKEVKRGGHPWWSLRRPRDPGIFASPKFVGLTTSRTIELIYDAEASVFVTDAMYLFRTVSGVDPWGFMAIMQSKIFLFLYRVSSQGESRVIPQVKASKLRSLPFPACDKPQPVLLKISQRCQEMYDLHQRQAAARTPQEGTVLARQIAATDARIDRLVYDLHGLSEDDVKIVEQAPL